MKHQQRVFYLTHSERPALVRGLPKMPRPSSVGGGLIGLFLVTWLSLITTLANAQLLTEELDSSRQTRANETCHHLTNISTNASIQGGQGDTIAGFIISGTGTKRVLLRGWGLDTGVNPKVTVQKFPSGELIASNDDWQIQTPPSLTITSNMGLSNPTDAGVLLDLPAGAYTLTLSSVGDKGRGLVGVDAIEPAGTPTTIKLINISTRAPILGVAGDVVAGFMISGTGMQQVLIRGWDYDSGVDTKLTVQKYPSGEVIVTNDNWQTPVASATMIPTVYQMPKDTDAAVLLNLPAGAYTATLESVGMTGLGLIGVDAVGDDSDCSSVTPPTTTTYPLNVTVQGSGKVTSAPAGIDCGTDCTENYAAATMVTLTATANANATFTGWSGACAGTGVSTSVTLDAAKSCTAMFEGFVSSSCPVINTVSCPDLGKLPLPSTDMPAWLGAGVDGDRNALKPVGCLNGKETSQGGGTAEISATALTHREDVLEEIKGSAGGKITLWFFKANADAKYSNIFNSSALSQSFALSYNIKLDNALFNIDGNQPLNASGEQYKGNQCLFKQYCGDQFVNQTERGANLFVSIDFYFTSDTYRKEFSLSAGAGLDKTFKKCEELIPISVSLNGEISKISQTTRSNGFMRLTAKQNGGQVELLGRVFGSPGKPAAALECSLKDVSACGKAIDNIIEYIKSEDFTNGVRQYPSTLKYFYVPYASVPGVPILSSEVTPEIQTAREELAQEYQKRLIDQERAHHLFEKHVLKSARTQELTTLASNLDNDVKALQKAAEVCFSDLGSCLNKKCEVFKNLTVYDQKIFDLQLEDDLMAYYPFDMDTQDASGNGHNGNAVGLIAYVPGKRGQAASFDGNSYIQIPDTKAFQSWKNRSVTLAAWVQVVDNGGYRPFITLGDTDTYPFVGIGKWAYNYSNAGIYLHAWDHVGHALSVNSLDNGNTLPKKQWLHVVGVEDYENLQAKLYVNGILQQVAKLGINVDMSQATSLAFLIGKFAHNPSKHYGLMDEAMIYGRALSEAEIQQLYGLNYTLNFK